MEESESIEPGEILIEDEHSFINKKRQSNDINDDNNDNTEKAESISHKNENDECEFFINNENQSFDMLKRKRMIEEIKKKCSNKNETNINKSNSNNINNINITNKNDINILDDNHKILSGIVTPANNKEDNKSNSSSEDIFASTPKKKRKKEENKLDLGLQTKKESIGYYIPKLNDIIINKYKVTGLCGKGIFSSVVKVVDIKSNKEYALKVLRSIDIMKASGQREKEIIKQLNQEDKDGIYYNY